MTLGIFLWFKYEVTLCVKAQGYVGEKNRFPKIICARISAYISTSNYSSRTTYVPIIKSISFKSNLENHLPTKVPQMSPMDFYCYEVRVSKFWAHKTRIDKKF